jgi:2-dehydro-3-deoxygluconokinase
VWRRSPQISPRSTSSSGRPCTRTFRLSGVVDRVGGGDAFAAGVLHGLIRGRDDRAALEFGLAAACLKHAVPGDFNLVREQDVLDLLAGGGLDVRR